MDILDIKEKLNRSRELEEERLAQYIAEKRNLSYIPRLQTAKVEALETLKEERAKNAQVVPYEKKGKRVFLAVANPESKETQEVVDFLTQKGFLVEKGIASKTTINHMIKIYKDIKIASTSKKGFLDISEDFTEEIIQNIKTIDDVAEQLENLQKNEANEITSKIVEIIVGSAIALQATDIHIEVKEKGGRVRFRLNSVLKTVAEIEEKTFDRLMLRIKLLSGILLRYEITTSDGRFSVNLANHSIDIRVSFIPELEKESVVLRVLDKNTIGLDIENLGLSEKVKKIFKEEAKRPTGMILNTGPTSSGKTTTLYSFLKYIKKPEIKIMTLENPVEYLIDGIVQTNISENVTFTQGLKTILRQNPNIILVGEIRDEEVAKTAADASLTGHLVLSTLHTNNAAGAIPRIIGFDIDPRTVIGSINLIIAQRLVRKLCPHCAVERVLLKREKENIEKEIKTMHPTLQKEIAEYGLNHIKTPPKEHICDKCLDGYNGLQIIVELLIVDNKIKTLVLDGKGTIEIEEEMRKRELPLIHQDGLIHAIKGTTSIEEIARVTGFNV